MSGRTARKVHDDMLGAEIPEMNASVALRMPSGLESDHYYDPLTPLVGPTTNVTPQPGKKKSKRSKMTPLTADAVAESKARRQRYDKFVDNLVALGGNVKLALCATYGIPDSEMTDEMVAQYRADVALGASTSSIAEMLEEAGIGKAVRVALMRRHAFSPDEKVSLVSLKLLTDLDGDKHDRGASYEQYLRMTMGKE